MKKETKEKLKSVFKENKKLIMIVALGLIGILLISFSEFGSDKNESVENISEPTVQTTDEEYLNNLEERLTELISSIENAGEVKVMITLKSSDEAVYAVNENIKSDDKSNSYSNNYVLIDNKNEKEAIKLKVMEPQVQGVAIVCSGGDNPTVVAQITDAVTAVLGIGSNKVSVSKMK